MPKQREPDVGFTRSFVACARLCSSSTDIWTMSLGVEVVSCSVNSTSFNLDSPDSPHSAPVIVFTTRRTGGWLPSMSINRPVPSEPPVPFRCNSALATWPFSSSAGRVIPSEQLVLLVLSSEVESVNVPTSPYQVGVQVGLVFGVSVEPWESATSLKAFSVRFSPGR